MFTLGYTYSLKNNDDVVEVSWSSDIYIKIFPVLLETTQPKKFCFYNSFRFFNSTFVFAFDKIEIKKDYRQKYYSIRNCSIANCFSRFTIQTKDLSTSPNWQILYYAYHSFSTINEKWHIQYRKYLFVRKNERMNSTDTILITKPWIFCALSTLKFSILYYFCLAFLSIFRVKNCNAPPWEGFWKNSDLLLLFHYFTGYGLRKI